MKIIVGADNFGLKEDFVKESIDEGIDEFFFGYIPERWLKNYGWSVCLNRRPFGSACNFSQTPWAVGSKSQIPYQSHRAAKYSRMQHQLFHLHNYQLPITC
jgi:hypothetical protein